MLVKIQAICLLVPEMICLTSCGIMEPSHAMAKAAAAADQTLLSSWSTGTRFIRSPPYLV